MIVHKLIKRGLNHPDYCEDFILDENLDENYSIYGVFDGCSSGIDSHLASALIAKIIRAEIKKIELENKSIDEILEILIYNTMQSLRQFKEDYNFMWSELLSTIILFLHDKNEDKGKIITIGDGFLSINNEQIEIDENNQPKYIAYFADEVTNKLSFSIWYDSFVGKYDIDGLEDVTISTDGILSFAKNGKLINKTDSDILPTDFLTNDKELITNKAMLGRKYNILKKVHSLHNLDDLGIIRIVK